MSQAGFYSIPRKGEPKIDLSEDRVTGLIQDQATFPELDRLAQEQDDVVGPAARAELVERRPKEKPDPFAPINAAPTSTAFDLPLKPQTIEEPVAPPVMGEVMLGAPVATAEEYDFNMDVALGEAQTLKVQEEEEAQMIILRDPELTTIEKIRKAQKLATSARPTPGEMFAKKLQPDGEYIERVIADTADKELIAEINQNVIGNILGNDQDTTFDTFMDKDVPWAKDLYISVVDNLHSTGEIDDATRESYMSTPAANRRQYMEFLEATKRPESLQKVEPTEWMNVWKAFAKAVATPGSLGITPTATLARAASRTDLPPEFIDEMLQNYGPTWAVDWSAYLAREVGTDLGYLFGVGSMAPARIAAAVFPAKTASLATRVIGAGYRAGIVAGGGTAAFIAYEEGIGREVNVAEELSIRFLASLGGEIVIKAATKVPGFANTMLDKALSFLKVNKLAKPLSKADVTQIMRLTMRPEGPAKTVAIASTRTEMGVYKQLRDDISKGLLVDPSLLNKSRTKISKLTGIPENELEMILAMANPLNRKVLKDIGGDELANLANIDNIGKSAAYYELKDATQEARVVLEDLILEHNALIREMVRTLKHSKVAPAVAKVETAEQRAIIKAKGDEIAESAKILAVAQKKLNDVAQAPVTTGNAMADNVLKQEAYGYQPMGDSTQLNDPVQDIFTGYINLHEGGYQFRPNDITEANPVALFRWMQRFKRTARIEEGDTLPMGNAFKDFFDAHNDLARLNKEYSKILDTAFKGLSNKGELRVMKALEDGNEAEQIWSVNHLRNEGLSSREIESYMQFRKALDLSHVINDQVITSRLVADGVKKYRGNPVRVYREGHGLTEEELESGIIGVKRLSDSKSATKETVQKIKETDLEELTSVMQAHRGYIPRVYKDNKYAVTIIDTASGQVKRVAAVARQGEARTIAMKMQAKANSSEIVVYHKWDETTNNMQISVPRVSMKVYDLLNNEKAELLKISLKEAGLNIDEANTLVAYFNQLDSTNLMNRFTGKRQDKVIGRLAPTQTAIADYLAATARHQTLGYWRDVWTERFKENYKQVLRPGLHWADPKAIPDSINSVRIGETNAKFISDEVLSSKLKEARLMQRQLRRAVFGTTTHERYFGKLKDNFVTNLNSSSSLSQRIVGRVLDRDFNLIKKFVAIGSYPKLLFASTGQITVQMSQIGAVFSTHPIYAAEAAIELAEITLGAIARTAKPGVRLPKVIDQSLAALNKSGYAADIRTSDLAELATAPSMPIPGKVGRAIQKGKSVSGTLITSPFTIGEGTNRIMAFLTVRREFTDLVKKGTLKGLNGKTFTGQVDDDEFLRLVTNKAKIFALNMGRAAKLEAMSGVGSVGLQFKQVHPKFTNMFETAELTGAAKIRLSMGLFTLWGYAGLVLIPDAMVFGDKIYRQFDDRPSRTEFFTQGVFKLRDTQKDIVDFILTHTPSELRKRGMDRELYNRFLTRGAISAFSDGDLDIANRVALGLFWTEAASDMTIDDQIVSFSVLVDTIDAGDKAIAGNPANIPSYLEALRLYTAQAAGIIPEGSYEEYIRDLRNSGRELGLVGDAIVAEDEDNFATDRILAEFGQAVSVVGSIGRYMQGMHDIDKANSTPDRFNVTAPFYKTSTGTPLIPLNKNTLFLSLMGLSEGDVVKELKRQEVENDYVTQYKDWIDSQMERYTSTRNRDTQLQIYKETVEDIDVMQSLLIGWEMENFLKPNWRTEIDRRFEQGILSAEIPREIQKVR